MDHLISGASTAGNTDGGFYMFDTYAQALVERPAVLRGDRLYVTNDTGGSGSAKFGVMVIGDGNLAAGGGRAKMNYWDYKAGVRNAANFGSPGTPIVTNPGATWTYVRMRTSGIGELQAAHANSVLLSDSLLFEIDDPLQFTRSSGSPKYSYRALHALTISCSSGSGVFEFRYMLRRFDNPGYTEFAFSERHSHRSVGGGNQSVITINTTAQMAYGDQLGVQVRRVSGSGTITLYNSSGVLLDPYHIGYY